jgi:hypothetical protein
LDIYPTWHGKQNVKNYLDKQQARSDEIFYNQKDWTTGLKLDVEKGA